MGFPDAVFCRGTVAFFLIFSGPFAASCQLKYCLVVEGIEVGSVLGT